MKTMFQPQISFAISPYTALYDLIVPKDHAAPDQWTGRSILRLRRFKVHYCRDNGCNAIVPLRTFKYLLLKAIFELSDADLVEHSCYDMSIKYFLQIAPEEDVINSSSLTQFQKLRLKVWTC